MKTLTPIDSLIDGGLQEGKITNIYGPAGSGKTNIALFSSISGLKQNKKIFYMDTESSFSTERFIQLGGNSEQLKNIIIRKPSSWKEQILGIRDISSIKEELSLIVIDSISHFYRMEVNKNNYKKMNKELFSQYFELSKLSKIKNIPILVISQVYSIGKEIEMTAKKISEQYSDFIVMLEILNSPGKRKAILKKPVFKEVFIEIKSDSIKYIKNHNFDS